MAEEVVKPFHCNYCLQDFDDIKDLVNDFLAHKGGITSYICKFCKKSFKIKKFFESHMRIHVQYPNGLPNQCNICGRVLSRPEKLKKHLVLHSQQFPFHCQFCGKGIVDKYRYNRHVSSHFKNEGGDNYEQIMSQANLSKGLLSKLDIMKKIDEETNVNMDELEKKLIGNNALNESINFNHIKTEEYMEKLGLNGVNLDSILGEKRNRGRPPKIKKEEIQDETVVKQQCYNSEDEETKGDGNINDINITMI